MPTETSPDSILRLFFAVPVPPSLHAALGGLQDQLRVRGAKVKRVEPENLHFTIKFLGDVPAGQLPAFEEAAAVVALRHKAFEAEVRGLGAFPTVRKPQVIWVAAGQGRERLEALGRDLIQSLANARLTAPEERPFVAHCTIGRVKDAYDSKALTEVLRQNADFVGGSFRCEALDLISSTLTRQGPVYKRVARMPLGAGAEPRAAQDAE